MKWPLVLTGGSFALLSCGRSVLGNPFSDTNADPTGGSGTDTGTGSGDTNDPSVGDPTGPSTGPATTGVPQPGPPRLIDVALLDGSTLELYFSEPIASTSGVDPGLFRLSAATHQANYREGTSYTDPGRWNGPRYCQQYCGCYYGEGGGHYYDSDGYYCYDECHEWCYSQPGLPVHVAAVANSTAPDRVLITLDPPLTSSVCGELAQAADRGADIAALFLHYSNNGPGITDLDGEDLAPIAEHWAILADQETTYQEGTFPYMDPFIPIGCPFF